MATCQAPVRSAVTMLPADELRIATPSRKFPGSDTSVKLNFERSAATWMLKFQPQPVPQLKLAVPMPFVVREPMVQVCPERVESPHWPCVWRLPVPEPAELSVTCASILTKPQPVVPRKAICQVPVKLTLKSLPAANAGLLIEITLRNESTATIGSRPDWRRFFMVSSSENEKKSSGTLRTL